MWSGFGQRHVGEVGTAGEQLVLQSGGPRGGMSGARTLVVEVAAGDGGGAAHLGGTQPGSMALDSTSGQ